MVAGDGGIGQWAYLVSLCGNGMYVPSHGSMSQESTFERSQRAPVALQFERNTRVFRADLGWRGRYGLANDGLRADNPAGVGPEAAD